MKKGNTSILQKIKSLFDEKMWKFLLVGILNTLVGNGLSFLLVNLVPWETFAVGNTGAVNISGGISTVLASIMSYFLNKNFTFRYQGKDRTVALRFALNIVVCYVIAYNLIGSLAVRILEGQSDWLIKNGSMVLSACAFVGCNYFGQRFFAFREKEGTEHSDSSEIQ